MKINNFKDKAKHLSNFQADIAMGQTSIGSYVVSVESPLYRVPSEDNSLFLDNTSLGRFVNRRFYQRLSHISMILREEKDQETIFGRLLEIGLEKQECDAIIDLFGSKSHRDVEFRVDWSEKEPIDEGYLTPLKLLHRDAQNVVAFRELLKSKENKDGIELSGEVIDLHRSYEDDIGRAKLKTILNGRDISVSFTVSEEYYPKVAKAHVGKKVVNILGNVATVKTGKRVTANFEEITQLEVIENLELDLNDENA